MTLRTNNPWHTLARYMPATRTVGAAMRRASLLLAAYWVVLGLSTHWPRNPVHEGRLPVDKLAHLVSFFGLAVLWARAFGQKRPGWIWLASSWLLLASYAALDEFTQQWCINRTCDFWDWVANLIGITTGLTVSTVIAYAMSRQSPGTALSAGRQPRTPLEAVVSHRPPGNP